ncbi:hypothetical protein [Acinetobacter baumannii]|uniref:hypothetical protein n=1 Tax=Acinetobacter baumannii TaxID=470 RepID=UPI000DE79F38|nr:hypothetical protein [Acinetobacter baumannii]EHU2374530.1 hypothetical protein [Acinetobacter baumannii]EHU2750689.1 hypothetical protein [Acinetobacter baumannii]MDC5497749.1 hypothetical protein [Acinetobacter baumannii]MDO7425247.1 hypothetical protein [Acinetobacter baumannii]RKL60737.1 hypothetical protein CKN54_02600 [Acinetobacter baumannii]
MNQKFTICIAIAIITLIPTIYFVRFGVVLDMPLSVKQEEWGQLGDFLGGVMNPLLSFITILLLLESLKCQNDANDSLTEQLSYSKQNEKIKVFENLFFHLISSQRDLYTKFKIKVILDNNNYTELYMAEAVDKIENLFIMEIEKGTDISELQELYEDIDSAYGIFDLVRSFCITVSLVKEHLSDENNFSADERLFYYEKLINLTEFAHIRLLSTALQFEKGPITQKLNDVEFKIICDRLSLNLFNVYNLNE